MREIDPLAGLVPLLRDACIMRMPFGKFGPGAFPPGGITLCDLPYEYLAYFERKGFPKGKLGELMKLVYQIKRDGAEALFEPFRTTPRRSLRPPRRPPIITADPQDDR